MKYLKGKKMGQSKKSLFILSIIFILLLCGCGQSTSGSGDSKLLNFNENTIITEGVGINEIKINDPSSKIESVFGNYSKKTNYVTYNYWEYNNYKINFCANSSTDKITEIQFNSGFPGKTTNGINFNSTLSEVKLKYPGYTTSVITSKSDFSAGTNNVLYSINDGTNPVYYKFAQTHILFWFTNSENLTQIVVY
jgi:hypothetical protein